MPKSTKRTATIKVGSGVPGFEEGAEVQVDVDRDGTPLDFEWRRRLAAGSAKVASTSGSIRDLDKLRRERDREGAPAEEKKAE